ncbi:hypothetical protein [Ornithinimicrobium cavernae]|uniref:hypothetical protein n=1 Tax=Ornithinimicrobium cavernae TaxID=2666047 RepID=UPI000D68A4B9|nr:hypothetical protein [Ornithinimicrobium cavernae]
MRTWVRRGLTPVLALLCLVAVAVTAPAGVTQAAWTDSRSVPLGVVTNDGISVDVTADDGVADLADTTTLGVHNTSARLDGLLSVEAGVAPVGWDSGLAARLTTGYATCASGRPVGEEPLAAGAFTELCLRTTPAQSGGELLRAHAGATVEITSTVTQRAATAPSWDARDAVTTRHALEFPRPTHPGDALTVEAVCRSSRLGPATLSWAWPDSSGHAPGQASPAVHHWGLQRWDARAQRWDEVRSLAGSERSTTLGAEVVLGLLQPDTFRIVGYPSADPGRPHIGTFQVDVRTVLGLLGVVVSASCTGVQAVS